MHLVGKKSQFWQLQMTLLRLQINNIPSNFQTLICSHVFCKSNYKGTIILQLMCIICFFRSWPFGILDTIVPVSRDIQLLIINHLIIRIIVMVLNNVLKPISNPCFAITQALITTRRLPFPPINHVSIVQRMISYR